MVARLCLQHSTIRIKMPGDPIQFSPSVTVSSFVLSVHRILGLPLTSLYLPLECMWCHNWAESFRQGIDLKPHGIYSVAGSNASLIPPHSLMSIPLCYPKSNM